jgi:dihydrodipicolinate synthase/N-acetylneuraminate lyase
MTGASPTPTGTRLGGCLPALVTPLTPQRAIDEEGVRTLVSRAVADGASGVLVAGSTGEGALLEPEQRVQLTRAARQALDEHPPAGGGSSGPLRLLAGASVLSVGALEADAARLAEAGAEAVLVLAPHTYPLAPEELVDLHLEVAARAPVPTVIYHIPQLTGSSLTVDAVVELAGHPGIVGMKDSSPDAPRRSEFLAAVAQQHEFELLTGHAPSLQSALEAGAHGSITAVANLRQHRVVALHEAVAAGDTERARQLQAGLTRLSEGIGTAGASVPATIKAALQLDGVIAERWCRPPLRSLDSKRLDRVRTALMT